MSQENIEVARRAIELFARGTPEAVLELLHPDIEAREQGPIGPAFGGREAAAQFLDDWSGTWEDFEMEIEELFDGGDWVVAFVTQRGRGRASGIRIEQKPALLMRFRDGLIIEFRTYTDRHKALAAARLSA